MRSYGTMQSSQSTHELERNERACSMLVGGLGSPKDLRKGHGSVLDVGTPFL